MKRNYIALCNFHVKDRESAYLPSHVQLAALVMHTPEMLYDDYVKAAKRLGINYMSEQMYTKCGFGPVREFTTAEEF